MFLDEFEIIPKIHFGSFARSGNGMTRRLLENITGITTGSA
jgi:hypothetical protein